MTVSKGDLQYTKMKIDSLKLCMDMKAQRAMAENDEGMYYILDMLRLELGCAVSRVQDAIDLLDERAKVVNDDGV